VIGFIHNPLFKDSLPGQSKGSSSAGGLARMLLAFHTILRQSPPSYIHHPLQKKSLFLLTMQGKWIFNKNREE
jgi:hypothetical protein